MNSKETDTREILEIVESTMSQFSEAMRRSEELSIRIGKRTTQIIRYGAAVVVLLSMAVIYLTASLKHDMSRMSYQMEEITGLMGNMSTSISTVPAMSNSVQRISTDFTAMNNQIYYLNQNIGSMGYNVDRMASPMKVFPFP
ncbi:MAG: hypothetical protein KAT25_04820 [Sulfuriflexus sp.]|nr:hypothetical protein [Sulfuriflexus sp.]